MVEETAASPVKPACVSPLAEQDRDAHRRRRDCPTPLSQEAALALFRLACPASAAHTRWACVENDNLPRVLPQVASNYFETYADGSHLREDPREAAVWIFRRLAA